MNSRRPPDMRHQSSVKQVTQLSSKLLPFEKPDAGLSSSYPDQVLGKIQLPRAAAETITLCWGSEIQDPVQSTKKQSQIEFSRKADFRTCKSSLEQWSHSQF